MNIERGIFEGDETPEQARERDARIAAAAEAAMQNAEYAARFGPGDEAARDAKARADIAAGRVYSHEEVAAWLKTWGTPDEKPFTHRWPR